MDTAQLLQSVQQAAQAAATAAQALKDANERRGTGFGEARKVVQCPKEFGTTSTTEDQSMWSDFAFSFKQWLFLADNGFEPDVKYVEENPNVAVAYQDNPVGQASKERSKKLYSILAGILKNRPLKLLRQIPDSNGLEAWRQLHNLYSPKTDKGASNGAFDSAYGISNVYQGQDVLGAVAIFGTFGRGIQKGKWARSFRRHLAEHFA